MRHLDHLEGFRNSDKDVLGPSRLVAPYLGLAPCELLWRAPHHNTEHDLS